MQVVSTMLGRRPKQDYTSRKWSLSNHNRLLAAPSFSRTLLTQSLASSFDSPHRENFLSLSGSSASPSKLPPEIHRYGPSLEERRREVFIENKARYESLLVLLQLSMCLSLQLSSYQILSTRLHTQPKILQKHHQTE